MIRWSLLSAAALFAATDPQPAPTPPIPDGVLIVLSGLFSVGTITAVLSFVRDLVIERRKRRDADEAKAVGVAKDLREGESIREVEYRELAEQSRKSAETAVTVIKASLEATQAVVAQLQSVIESQNRTISTLTAQQGEQSTLLHSALEDRDRTQRALQVAEQKARHEERERARLEIELQEKERDLEMLDDLVHASVGVHARRPPTGPIPTSKEPTPS